MRKRGWLQHPRDWQHEYMLFSLKFGYVYCSLGSGASSLLLLPKNKKKRGSANLVIIIQLSFFLFTLEKGAQLVPVK